MALTAPLTTAVLIANGHFNRPVDPIGLGMDSFEDYAHSARVDMLRTYEADDATFNQARDLYIGELGTTALLVCTATAPEASEKRAKPEASDIVPIGLACRGVRAIASHERQRRLTTIDAWYGELGKVNPRMISELRKNGPVERLAKEAGYDRPDSVRTFAGNEWTSVRDQVNRGFTGKVAGAETPSLEVVSHELFTDIISAQTDAERNAYVQALDARRQR